MTVSVFHWFPDRKSGVCFCWKPKVLTMGRPRNEPTDFQWSAIASLPSNALQPNLIAALRAGGLEAAP